MRRLSVEDVGEGELGLPAIGDSKGLLFAKGSEKRVGSPSQVLVVSLEERWKGSGKCQSLKGGRRSESSCRKGKMGGRVDGHREETNGRSMPEPERSKRPR
jgi:hypothetical protein